MPRVTPQLSDPTPVLDLRLWEGTNAEFATHYDQIRQASWCRDFEAHFKSGRSMTGRIGSVLPAIVVAHLAAAGITGVTITSAQSDDCLAAPNGPSTKGHHWFYRLERTTQRKCWYQRAQGSDTQQVARSAPPSKPSPAPSQRLQMAAPAPANDPAMAPMAFAQSAWPETTASGRREPGAFTAPSRRDPTPNTQSVDRPDLGMSVATKPVAVASNDVPQPQQPQFQPAPIAPAAVTAPVATSVAAAPPASPETFTPFRMVLLAIGILFVPGILLQLIFKFGTSARQRIYTHQQDVKRNDGVAPEWGAVNYNAAEVPPLEPMRPINQVLDAEQLLRKILRELDRSTAMPMPDALSGGARR